MKGRKHRETGGANEAEEDVKTKPENRTDTGDKKQPIRDEAEALKKGGRAKRKSGGRTGFGPEHQATVPGKKGGEHAGRKPRKSGGRTGSDSAPFTSARKGTDAPGRKLMKDEQDVSAGED
jgi:hypothetical protein